MSGEIGELLEEPGVVRGLWRIPGILSLLEGQSEENFSPKFLFSDACWRWEMYLVLEEWIGLYLCKKNCDSPKKVRYTFGIRDASGEVKKSVRDCRTFAPGKLGFGTNQFLKLSELRNQGTELAPSGVLTISYTLESDVQHPSEGSLFRRLWDMSLSFRNILSSGKKSDVTLKLKDGKISAHSMILESRSPKFNRMFNDDKPGRKTSEVNIKDATEDAFQVALYYAYGGDPEGLSCENACEVYKIARDYEFEELRKLCTKFMLETLSVETICDVITVAHMHQETALMVGVRNYFAKNKSDVFKSEKWKIFKRDNPFVSEMFEWVLGEEI